jgi:hypothetical protein
MVDAAMLAAAGVVLRGFRRLRRLIQPNPSMAPPLFRPSV